MKLVNGNCHLRELLVDMHSKFIIDAAGCGCNEITGFPIHSMIAL